MSSQHCSIYPHSSVFHGTMELTRLFCGGRCALCGRDADVDGRYSADAMFRVELTQYLRIGEEPPGAPDRLLGSASAKSVCKRR